MAVGVEACIRAVAKTYGSSENAILESRRGLENEARRMAMYGVERSELTPMTIIVLVL